MSRDLPRHVRVVIAGGGIIGCSVAYHLTKLGWTDVVLLEQNQLTSGTTWHAAGLVGQLRASRNLTRLACYATDLYARLEEETGQATGFVQTGSVIVARTPDRMTELQRGASMARAFGIEVEAVGPAEVTQYHPMVRTDDLVGGLWLPGDGRTSPVDTTQALAKGARRGGARIFENSRVTGVRTKDGRVVGVTVGRNGGERQVGCEVLVNAAGAWAREFGRLAGVAVPLHAAEHMYVVTEAIDGVTATLPTLRDYDGRFYMREDAGKLLIGGFEPVAKPWPGDGMPHDRPFIELPEDWEHFDVLLQAALERIPALETAGIRRFFNGPESFTPDTAYYLGEAPELPGFYVAAGFNSVGIASAAGAGKALAEWIAEGRPTMDLWDVDIRRSEPFQNTTAYLRTRIAEALGVLYAMHWPYRQPETARDARLTQCHDAHRSRGACFGIVAGWERPLWYGSAGEPARMEYSYGPQAWWPHARAEACAAREAVALFDMSPFANFTLDGPDAEGVLRRLCANDVAVEPGRVVYTQLLNDRGGIEADLTVTRLGEDSWWIVTGPAVRRRDLHHIRRHIPPDARAVLTDVTSGWAAFGIMGPRARDLLSGLTDADVSAAAFPFAAAREIEIGYAPARALRVSYVGELGYELYVPTEFARPVHDLIAAAGERLGLVHAGLFAQDSLRLEKGFKHWGHDIGIEDTPLEAGLGFAVAFDRNRDFIGREALLRQRETGIGRRLVLFTVEEGEPLLLHEEPVWRDGVLVGSTTSGNRGFTVGKPVCFAWVAGDGGPVGPDWLLAGRYEIEVAGERFPATPHLGPLVDPQGARMRA